MGMSDFYVGGSEAESIATIHRALELGVTFLDTADMYGRGANEELVGRAISGRRDKRRPRHQVRHRARQRRRRTRRRAASPNTCAQAARRASSGSASTMIDLYYQHRVDPKTPIEETVGAMAELVRRGQGALPRPVGGGAGDHPARAQGASHRGAADANTRCGAASRRTEILADRARARHRLRRLQPAGARLSHRRRSSRSRISTPTDYRRSSPRFQGENFQKNLDLVATVAEIAAEKRCTPAQLALAWVLAQGDDVVPIPGTKRPRYIAENIGALALTFTPADMQRIDSGLPAGAAAGERYAALKAVNALTPRQALNCDRPQNNCCTPSNLSHARLAKVCV